MPVFKSIPEEQLQQVVTLANFSLQQLEDLAQQLTKMTSLVGNIQTIVSFDKYVRQLQAFILQIPDVMVQQKLQTKLDALLNSLGSVFSRIDIWINYDVNQLYLQISTVVLTAVKQYDDLFRQLLVYQQVVDLSILPATSVAKSRWLDSYNILEAKKLVIP